MNKFTRFLSFALALTLTFTSVDMNVFAAELNEAEPSIVKTEESTSEENTEKPSQQESSDAETSADQNKSDSNDDNKSNETTNTQEGEANPEETQEDGEALVEEELEVEEAEEQEMLEEGEGWSIDNDGVLTFDSNVKEIPAEQFKNNTSIKTVVFPDKLMTIGDEAFYGCTSLSSVSIPQSVNKMGALAFANSGVKTVVVNSRKIELGTTWDGSAYRNKAFEGCPIESLTFGSDVVEVPSLFTGAEFKTGSTVTIGGNITSIAADAFYNAKGLTTVVFEGTKLTRIDKAAFENCVSLENIELPAGLQEIGDEAFYGCTSLTTVTIPQKLSKMGALAFANSGVKNVVVNANKIEVGATWDGNAYRNKAFEGCPIESLTFGSDVVEVPSLFTGAEFKTGSTVTIGGNITSIAADAFYNAKGLTTVVFEGTKLTRIDKAAFENCVSLENIELPAGLQEIGDEVFYGCTSLTSVTIPQKVNKMGALAFANSGVKNVVVNANKIEVGTTWDGNAYRNKAFEGCPIESLTFGADVVEVPSLFTGAEFKAGTTVTIGGNITSIASNAFYNAKGLTTVVFEGSKLTSINKAAFESCVSLENVELPAGLQEIGDEAFYGCTSLTTVTIPQKLSKMGALAFANSGVKSVVVNAKSIEVETTWDGNAYRNKAFAGCPIESLTFGADVVVVPALFAGAVFKSGTSITIGGNIIEIAPDAFYSARGLSEVKLEGDKLQTIGKSAFYGTTDLEKINFPSKLVKISETAFSGSGITEAIIPASVQEVGPSAFYNCDSLQKVSFLGKSVTFQKYYDEGYTFAECNSLDEIILPSGIKSIPQGFLYNSVGVKKIILGNVVSKIGADAFAKDDLAYFYAQKGSATEKALKAYGIPADRIVSMNGITYKLNGGELNGYCPSVYSTQDGSIQIADPTRENYKFAGWFKDAKFTKLAEKSVNGITTIDVSNQSGNITLYAKWEGPIYTVTLNPGVNATVAITSMEVYKNSTYGKYNDNTDKELPVPSATGKTFKGWFTADGDLVTADTKVTDEAKDQVLYAKYKNNVDTVEAPELLDSNGLTVLPTDEKTDITKFYFKSATADATIIYTVKAENGAASENTYSDGFALEAGKTYTITAYATKENWTDSPKNTWTVTVVDSVSAEDTPALYKPEYEGKFWVVFQGAIYDETKVSTVYTGANVKLSGYQVYYGKKLLEENKDYKVSYKNNKKIAKYDEVNKKGASIAPTMIITGKGNTKGKLELRFNIEGNEDAVKLTNSNTTFELSESVFDYDGTAHTPEVKNLQIKATKKTEAVAIDAKSYTVSYEKNVAAGTAKVVVTFDGKEYFGVLTKNFKINKTDIKNAIEGDKPFVAIEKSNKVSYNNGYNALKSIKNTKTGNDLVLKSEYTISKAKVNSKTMTATQTITGKGSFKGSYKITFDVEKADIKDADVVNFVAPVASTKKGVYKPVAFKVLFDGTLLKGSEYSVKYTVNGQAPSNKVVYGTDAKVVMTITGKGNYVGTKTFEYSPVVGYDISDAAKIDVTVSDAAYTGKANGVNPSIVVKNIYTNKKLANKKDYTVSYKYANETEIKRTAKKKACDYVAEAGEAVKAKDTVPAGTTIIAVIEGKGAYAGKSIERKFRVGYDLSKATVKIKDQTYTGKQIIPSKNDITVKVAGKELKANEYNVTIANVENVKAGTGKIIITGTNTSSKQKVVNFRIVARTLSLKDEN